jgi:hypothetical protein
MRYLLKSIWEDRAYADLTSIVLDFIGSA